MQRPRASLRRRSPNSSNTRSAFGSRTRYAPRRRRSFLAAISPPPTTGMPSSSISRASIASTSRYRTAIFDFANTISSVEEYPRLIREAISRHAALRPSSKPFKKALRVSSSPIPMARIRPRRAYRDFAASANVPEVFALVRRLRRSLDVLQLRRDLVDLLRLRLQLVEGNLDSEVLRQHFEDGLRGLRVDEISGRLAHEADRVHVVQSAEAQQQAARPDNPGAWLAAREHDSVLLHLLHELQARRGPEDPRLRHHAAHPIPAEGEDAAHPELLQLLEDEVAQLVLPLRREALVVPREEDQVRPVVPLDVVHLVVHELDLAVVLDEDLRREVLREDLRELDALQLVLQMFGRELADVPDAREALDEDRVFQFRMVEVPDHDVVHGLSSLQFMGPLKFAPVRAVAVLRGVPRGHRVAGGVAARRAHVVQRVAAARPAFLQDGSHPSILPVELRLAAFRGQRLDDPIRRLLNLLFRGLVVRRAHDDPIAGRADVLDLHAQAVVLLDRLRERLADVHRAVGTEVHRLDVPVDRHVRRDDVLPGDLDERLDPRAFEAFVLEGALVHHALLERAVERAERVQQAVAELFPARLDGLAEAGRHDPEEVLRLLLVLPFLDLLAALVLVDRLQREVDVAFVLVDLEDLADDLLPFAHVVADVLDPARADLGDVDEALLVLVLVQGHEGPEVLHVRHGADDEFALVRPLVLLAGRLRLGHYSRTPRISPRTTALPPVGFATVAPQTWQSTVLAARSKTICSLPQSSHFTRRNRLVGFGITCGPPRARTSSRGCRAAGAPCGIPGSGSGDGSSSSASRVPRASGEGSRRTRP